jgi:hypothetical protein
MLSITSSYHINDGVVYICLDDMMAAATAAGAAADVDHNDLVARQTWPCLTVVEQAHPYF